MILARQQRLEATLESLQVRLWTYMRRRRATPAGPLCALRRPKQYFPTAAAAPRSRIDLPTYTHTHTRQDCVVLPRCSASVLRTEYPFCAPNLHPAHQISVLDTEPQSQLRQKRPFV